MQSLNYPVMLVTPKFILGSINSEKQLTTVGELQYEKGCFDNSFIIDSSGKRFQIVSTSVVKKSSVFLIIKKSIEA